MASSSSSTLRTARSTKTSVSTCPDDDKELVPSFGTLGLGKDFGFLRNQERREEIATSLGQRQRKVDIRRAVAPFFAGHTSEYQDNIWAYENSSHGGGAAQASNGNLYLEALGGENISGDPFYGDPSASFSANEFLGNPRGFHDPAASVYDLGVEVLNYGVGPYGIDPNMYASHELNAARSGNDGPYLGTWYSSSNNVASPSSYDDQSSKQLLNKLYIDMLARDQYGSQILQSPSQSNGTMRTKITERVPKFPQPMEDQHGHHLFQKHLDGSTETELELILKFISEAHQKPKEIPQSASMLTSSLSTKFFELVIHRTGRHVIKQCFNLLGDEPNKVLYDQAIRRCCEIATDKVGCLSLNDCIDCISTSQRKDLLNKIVEKADFLSEDPSGNYVVQHVLKLQNQELTDKICSKLRGQYTDLSSKKGGSHVVEKCITSSRKGMEYAVEEFLENGRTPSQLARDQYGNYVIQRALKSTKVEDIENYIQLVSALLQNSGLENHKYGKNASRPGGALAAQPTEIAFTFAWLLTQRAAWFVDLLTYVNDTSFNQLEMDMTCTRIGSIPPRSQHRRLEFKAVIMSLESNSTITFTAPAV
ncbi:hypothetical protein RJ639_022637 [Escallonia herrerae]|uniref:PUM-HD domain-containing protein n=1 Tax=Escallonia herrerae TaxID=1293975 RepID=A0AA88V1L3_9ASTE|nr:hypothetical protein RJ639_022637 [Escallonia herrerae]